MMRPMLTIAALLAVMTLSACGERDQTLAANRHKSDDQPWKGANDGFRDKSWTPSDKAGWETQFMRFMREQMPEVRKTLVKEKKLTPAFEEQLKKAIETFQKQYKA